MTMNDKEMIEEMAKDLKEEKLYALINKTSYMRSAENLYKAGYRKIPENAVVLTREEYEKIFFYKELYDETKMREQKLNEFNGNLIMENQTLKDKLDLVEQDTRKETAREILQKIDYESNGQTKQITDLLRKQYGVDLGE